MTDVHAPVMKKLDPEWIILITQAKSIGLSIQEVQEFIRRKSHHKLQ
ncbi:anti-repressor SinI family protein [Virgibacillus kimchii]